jgi:hypothetical protein
LNVIHGMTIFPILEPIRPRFTIGIHKAVQGSDHADKSVNKGVDIGGVPPLILRAKIMPVLRRTP